VKEQIDAIIRTAILGAIAAAAGMTAFLFAVVAAFLWAQQRYDTIVAALTAGGIFLLAALIALIWLFVARRRAERRRKRREAKAAASAPPSWLTDPAMLIAAAQVVRTVGLGRLIPIALTGLAAFGAAGVMGSRSAAKERKAAPNETKRAA
jgi:heme/copper-type cytochrome/quinol oxidase subunit 2